MGVDVPGVAPDQSVPGTGVASVPARTVRPPASLALLAALILCWAAVYLVSYVPSLGNGSDFQVFYAASHADAHGSDPFDWPSLWRAEQSLYNGGVGHGTPFAFAPYADPPPFALVLRPLLAVSQSDAYRLWALLLLLSAALGTYAGLNGWPRIARLRAAAIVAVCPAALFDLRLGQNSTPLLLCLGAAVYFFARRQPVVAGVLLSVGLVKPHLMGPIAVVAILAAPRDLWPRALLGLFAGGICGLGSGMLFDGGPSRYASWLRSVGGFGDSIRHQPDLASVPGFYLGSVSHGTASILNLLSMACAALIVGGLVRGRLSGTDQSGQRLLAGGIAAWLSFSPYVHTSDQVLLALPLLWLIGPHGMGLRAGGVLLATTVAILAPMVVLRDYHTVGINALPPLCLLAAVLTMSPRHAAQRSVASENAETREQGRAGYARG